MVKFCYITVHKKDIQSLRIEMFQGRIVIKYAADSFC